MHWSQIILYRIYYIEVVTLHRGISKAVYCLHSRSMKRCQGRMTEGWWVGGQCHLLYRDLPLNINTPCIPTKHYPIKQQRNCNWPWVQDAGWQKYSEAWCDLQWATSQVHSKSGGSPHHTVRSHVMHRLVKIFVYGTFVHQSSWIEWATLG